MCEEHRVGDRHLLATGIDITQAFVACPPRFCPASLSKTLFRTI